MLKIICASLTLALASQVHAGTDPKKTLTAFSSDAQLKAYLDAIAKKNPPIEPSRRFSATEDVYQAKPAPAPESKSAAPPVANSYAPAAPAAAAESITNTQTAGVDEGGIVKVHGKHLVMLRRGKLFTVAIGQDQLKPVASIDAFPPKANPPGDWYDEMLISGDTVVVIGYSYSRGGTEIGLFDIDAAGGLRYRSTYHMRSDDYFSAGNYASRQVGGKLIFYTPLTINPAQPDPFSGFPALRKWRPDATPADFKRIAPATRIYRTDDEFDADSALALHSVTVCDLASREMRCEASAVLGPRGRVFYVSGESVYVWTTGENRSWRSAKSPSGLFRLPLDGGAPSALKVAGAPVDQFSFLESDDGHLNVVVRSDGQGEGMWLSRQGRGALALMRVPLNQFSDGRDSVPASSYRALPNSGGAGVQNRFVGSWLLYGGPDAGSFRDGKAGLAQALHASRWDNAGVDRVLGLRHGVERIEPMGDDAVVVGSNGPDLHFTSVALGRDAALAHRYVRPNAAQGETRSHGFFYKPQRADEGMIGLPILSGRVSDDGRGGAASVLYLRNSARKLSELGALASRPVRGGDDGCQVSCVDWYGNARPLFLGGRVFALMGYELVEGRVDGASLREVRRINYSPRAARGR